MFFKLRRGEKQLNSPQLGDFILIIPSMKLLPSTPQQAHSGCYSLHIFYRVLNMEWIIELHWQQSVRREQKKLKLGEDGKEKLFNEHHAI